MEKLNMKKNTWPGKLFTFCGLDGCGKTTMIGRLRDALGKRGPVEVVRQPTDAVRRSAIFRTYMDCPDHSAYDYRSLSLMAAADRLQHDAAVIVPLLCRGVTVLCDRYFYSCLANLRARGYTSDRWIYEIAQSVTEPDAAFFLDLPVETAVGRVRSRAAEKDRYIDMELQYRLREEYRGICQSNGGILLSTLRPEEECFARILEETERSMKK